MPPEVRPPLFVGRHLTSDEPSFQDRNRAASVSLAFALRSFAMPFVSSDPHAWLRPLYARLRSDHTFGLLSTAHQFEALVSAVEKESPMKGAAMREWSPDAHMAVLKWL